MMIKNKIRVVELFAGVGGFRLGFEQVDRDLFETVWANQWEPSRKKQHAYDCYAKNFGPNHNCINDDITKVKFTIPDHDLLVGGFPCQDYSVASSNAKGIEGKKGVLWWEIRDIIENKKPSMVFLENVDRLLKSPSKQRGRDFGVMLRCFDELGYFVEWKVVNAADYGHPQKRRRVFIFAYRKENGISKFLENEENKNNIILEKGILAQAFPGELDDNKFFEVDISNNSFSSLVELSNNFSFNFKNSGYMNNGKIVSTKIKAIYNGPRIFLGDVLEDNIQDKYIQSEENLSKWIYLKGSKKEERIKPNGDPYFYAEGAIPFPDNLNSPSRTMLTAESSINRSSHIILDKLINKYRILTPEECERLNEFPAGWTNTGMPEKFRYFTMGNALVVGLIRKVASVIKQEIFK
jgi:DNA (cytosine-5)-methyltransferase 1